VVQVINLLQSHCIQTGLFSFPGRQLENEQNSWTEFDRGRALGFTLELLKILSEISYSHFVIAHFYRAVQPLATLDDDRQHAAIYRLGESTRRESTGIKFTRPLWRLVDLANDDGYFVILSSADNQIDAQMDIGTMTKARFGDFPSRDRIQHRQYVRMQSRTDECENDSCGS